MPLNATVRDDGVVPLVLALTQRIGPSTVARLVVAVLVESINALAFRLWPHRSYKAGKFMPLITNLDASAAVIFEVPRVRVVAAINHRFPRPIRGMPVQAVSGVGFYNPLFVVTATRNLNSANKRASLHYPRVSAVAPAAPQAGFVWPIVWLLAFNDKKTEAQPSQV